MTRGLRGATTVIENNEEQISANTKTLITEMISKNMIDAETISHVFISMTNDLNAVFPAKYLRSIPGWSHVPAMCMTEIDVPGSLAKCIRVIMVVRTNIAQKDMQHIYHNEATKLRPDLI